MKLWNNYRKEMKIASRGFYFYMEILMAAMLLVALLVFVPVDLSSVSQEVIFADMPEAMLSAMLEANFGCDGEYVQVEDTTVKLKAATIVYYDEQTDEEIELIFDEKKTLAMETWEYYDPITGQHEETLYFVDSFEDMVRVAQAEKLYATRMSISDSGEMQYEILLFGTESERYLNLIAASFGSMDTAELEDAVDSQTVVTLGEDNVLNNRQSYIPMAVVLMNGLMGMLVVIAYLTIDKSTGLIRAMALTPMHTRSYLMSKVLVVMTMSLISSLVITIPVMGMQANYLLFVLAVGLISALSCMIGLWMASFFEDLKSAFGVIIGAMVLFMIPALSYILPSFAPLWIKLMPTYPMLTAVKETLLPSPDTAYVLIVCAGMAVLSWLILLWAERRYRKSLGV